MNVGVFGFVSLALSGLMQTPVDACFSTARERTAHPQSATLIKAFVERSGTAKIELLAANGLGTYIKTYAACPRDGSLRMTNDRLVWLMQP